jgi:hypothetical protein
MLSISAQDLLCPLLTHKEHVVLSLTCKEMQEECKDVVTCANLIRNEFINWFPTHYHFEWEYDWPVRSLQTKSVTCPIHGAHALQRVINYGSHASIDSCDGVLFDCYPSA